MKSPIPTPDLRRVLSPRFGKLEVPVERLLTLPLGLAGFEEAKTFVLVELRCGSRFRWLQCMEHPDVAFVVIDATSLVPAYPMDQVRRALAFCDLEPREEIVALAVCRATPGAEPPTVNLQAPIALGLTSRRGAQLLLHDPAFNMQMPLGRGCTLTADP